MKFGANLGKGLRMLALRLVGWLVGWSSDGLIGRFIIYLEGAMWHYVPQRSIHVFGNGANGVHGANMIPILVSRTDASHGILLSIDVIN